LEKEGRTKQKIRKKERNKGRKKERKKDGSFAVQNIYNNGHFVFLGAQAPTLGPR
jgi:hypothetical protein